MATSMFTYYGNKLQAAGWETTARTELRGDGTCMFPSSDIDNINHLFFDKEKSFSYSLFEAATLVNRSLKAPVN